MSDCKDTVEITRKASDLNVTPTDEMGRPVSTIPDYAGGEVVLASADATEAPAADEAASGGPDPELVAAGERAFRQCSACHQVGEGAQSRTGPQLNNLFGRTAGTYDGFRFSRAFVQAGEGGLVWTEETLHDFLSQPRSYIEGTRMSFRGFRDEADIAAVTAYLQTYME